MPNLHLLTQTFSQARHASGTDQFNGLGPPLTKVLIACDDQAVACAQDFCDKAMDRALIVVRPI
jgi:hypothetical protein